MKHILMILTSHEQLDNTDKTIGAWLGEFTEPYYKFIDKGYNVTLASPKGGQPPVDPRSRLTENITSSNRRFEKDDTAQAAFKTTKPLTEINAADYDAVFYPGGHGPMWDLAQSEINADLLLEFYRNKKPVAAICHGPAALLKAAGKEPQLLKDKEVTAFSNAEERLVGLYNNIPFKLEDRLKAAGANYDSSTIPFTGNVKVSGTLITGQNPASAGGAAEKLIEVLEGVKLKVS